MGRPGREQQGGREEPSPREYLFMVQEPRQVRWGEPASRQEARALGAVCKPQSRWLNVGAREQALVQILALPFPCCVTLGTY